MSLTQVETPPLYGGDTSNSVATVRQSVPPGGGKAYCAITLSPPPIVPLYRLDQIQVGYQGFWITLDENNAAGGASGAITNPAKLTGYVDISHGETPAWTVQPISGPFSVKRWPTKSIASPLQFPSPACIDLTWSGVEPVLTGDTPTWFISKKTNSPVTIMFAPNGSVDKIYVTVNSSAGETYHEVKVASPIYLLVGNRERVINPPDPSNQNTNLNNISDLWVAINASTGMTFVTDMAASGTTVADLQKSRAFARQSSAMGGK